MAACQCRANRYILISGIVIPEGMTTVTTPSNTPMIALAGDVMAGRGVDQILPSPSSPRLYERHVGDARVYVRLAERRNGRVPRPVPPGYVWGAARETLARRAPAAFLMNLETAITVAEQPWPGKGIHYRMHPRNAPVLTQAGTEPDKSCCILANNHILDWGYRGSPTRS